MPFSLLILLAISLPFSPIGFSTELLTFLLKSNYLSDGNWIYHNIYTPLAVILFDKRSSFSSVEYFWRNFSALSSIWFTPIITILLRRFNYRRLGNLPSLRIFIPFPVSFVSQSYSTRRDWNLWRCWSSSPIAFPSKNISFIT